MRVEAFAKINLILRVDPPSPTGLHPIRSLAQTIDWSDILICDRMPRSDSFTVEGADLLADEHNLVSQGVPGGPGRHRAVAPGDAGV